MYLLVLAVLTCVARRVQGRAWCGLDRVACLVACDSVLPKIILETIGQSPPRRLDARERVPPAFTGDSVLPNISMESMHSYRNSTAAATSQPGV